MLLKAKDKPTDTAAEPSPPTAAAKDAAPATASIVAWLSALTVMVLPAILLRPEPTAPSMLASKSD